MRIEITANKKIPDHWAKMARVPVEEFRAWRDGTLKEKKEPTGPKLRRNPRKDFAVCRDGVLTITIHELPPSQNAWKKWHWSVVAAEKGRWEKIIWDLVQTVSRPEYLKPVIQINFYFPDNRRRDPSDNYMSWKALTDGLTMAGVIPDDAWQFTRVLEPGVEIDRGNPRTEIVVREG